MNKSILVITFLIVATCTVVLGTKSVECQPEEDHCKDTKRSRKREVICQEGEYYHQECNLCSCEQGAFTCTEHSCNKKREAIVAHVERSSRRYRRGTQWADDLKNTPCAPNDYFKIDCNMCYCNTEGSGYLCTENIGCQKETESSTTKQIPLKKDTMLLITDHQVQIVKDYNSNDNSISRIADHGTNNNGKSHHVLPVPGVNDTITSEKVSPAPQVRASPKDVTPAPVHLTEKTPSAP